MDATGFHRTPIFRRSFDSFAEIVNSFIIWITSKDETFFEIKLDFFDDDKIVASDGQFFDESVCLFYFEINAFLYKKKQTEFICIPNKLAV